MSQTYTNCRNILGLASISLCLPGSMSSLVQAQKRRPASRRLSLWSLVFLSPETRQQMRWRWLDPRTATVQFGQQRGSMDLPNIPRRRLGRDGNILERFVWICFYQLWDGSSIVLSICHKMMSWWLTAGFVQRVVFFRAQLSANWFDWKSCSGSLTAPNERGQALTMIASLEFQSLISRAWDEDSFNVWSQHDESKS